MAASINEELERCKDWIEAALEYSGGTHEWSDIVEGIHSLRYQFWPAEKGCAVTEIILFPKKKIFHVFLAGGEMDQIVDMNDSAAQFAKAQGCDGMSIAGRKGWSRVLKNEGWTESFTTLAKEL
ncbi:MAG: hypothetical protein CMJ25_24390 [Phycisphaerae bacterium]|nr:hypothetical protein [Phycisphaerae bacterium]|tara:strand:+ start:2774 stop:3145 length:372 start_codon:yes stop_codon:yes gene_type:complete